MSFGRRSVVRLTRRHSELLPGASSSSQKMKYMELDTILDMLLMTLSIKKTKGGVGTNFIAALSNALSFESRKSYTNFIYQQSVPNIYPH